MTVKPAAGAPVITSNVERARVLIGQPATFSITPTGGHQWQKGTATSNMVDIPGATSPTYTTPATALRDNATIYRCTASNSAGNATSSSEMVLVTGSAKPPNKIRSMVKATAYVGVPFSYRIVSSGGTMPITYDASPLPDGLSVDVASGVISGTPKAAGVSNVTMSASNSAGRISALLVLEVVEVTH